MKRVIPVKRTILFGSFAYGKAIKDSDVDLIILSDKFAEFSDDERLCLLYRLSVGFPYNLHVYGLTEEELEDSSSLTTLGEVKMHGIVIEG